MNYKEQLLTEHSCANTDLITKAIGNSETEFKKIIDIIYNEQPPLPQRASWVVASLNNKNPRLVRRYIPLFVETVKQFKVDGIKRNLMLVLATQPKIYLPQRAKLIDICFEFMCSPTETVAVKVHAMQVIANFAKQHPELVGELKMVIEDQLPKTTVAFAARARHVFKELGIKI